MKTLLKGKYVIGHKNDDHSIIENGEVVFKDDTIIFVGKNYEGEYDRLIDKKNAVISPGFIDLNAIGDIDHDLLHMEVEKDKQNNLEWSQEYYQKGPHEFMTPEEEAFKSLYNFVYLIMNGVTTALPITSVLYKKWAETYEEAVAAVHNAGNLGLRLYFGPSYQYGAKVVNKDGEKEVVWDKEKGSKGLENAVKFIKFFDGAYNGLIRGMLAPERIETQTKDSLIKTKEYSEELDCPVRLHAAQGLFDYKEIKRRYNKTPIGFLNEINFLDKNIAIPHAHYVSGSSKVKEEHEKDLEYLKKSNTTVIHCPLIINRHGSPLETFAKYYKNGINMGTGTDTYPPDYFQLIRNGSMVSRIFENDLKGSRFADLYRASTLGGARFLNRDDLGKITPGAKADIIVINIDEFEIGPIDDPIRTMFLSGSGKNVEMSIIDGKIVMQDRKIEGINLDKLKNRAQCYFDKMKKGYKERSYQSLEPGTLFKSSFPQW